MATPFEKIRNRVSHEAKAGWQWVDSKVHPFPQNYGPAFVEELQSLEASQWWSAKQHKDHQEKQLAALLEHAYAHVPYYTRVFDERRLKPKDIRGIKDLPKLPFLTKQLIRENYEDLIATNVKKGDWIESHTSGSTGHPLTFLLDKHSSNNELAYTLRAWSFGSYQLGDPVIILRSFVPKPGQPLHYHDKRKNYHYLSAYHLTPEVMHQYVKLINKTGATILRGYPSSLYIFCRFLLDENITLPNITTAITSSEIILPHYRATIGAAIGGNPVLDWYGCNERVVTASQCPQSGSAYHTNSEYGIIEAVDEHDNIITEGTGRIIGTSLKNFVMPLIRYQPNDLITVQKPVACACGRGLPLQITKIEGRSDEILAYGKLMTPSANFYTLFQTIPGVQQFQLVQHDETSLQVLLVANDAFTATSRERVEKGLHDRIGQTVKLDIELVSEIPRDLRTGKIKAVLSHLKRP